MAWQLYQGDCLEVLKQYPDSYFDSIVTDPPYELGFMGKKWDSTGIAYKVDLWQEVLRVLKPGGYLLSFGGTRTYHRMACAIEDAGFEIRDQIQWIYGCLDEATEVLTNKGWKKYFELSPEDEVLQWDSKTSELSWTRPSKIHIYPYEGKMYHFANRHTDQLLTPNHRVYGKFRRHSRNPKPDVFEVVEAQHIKQHWQKDLPVAGLYKGSKHVDESYAYLVGWWLTDAWAHQDGKACMFSQSKPDTLLKLREALSKFNCSFSEYTKAPRKDTHNAEHTFYVTGSLANKLLNEFPTRELNISMLEWNIDSRKALLKGLLDGDGTYRDGQHCVVFWSKKKERLDLVQLLAMSLNYRTLIDYKKGCIHINPKTNTTQLQHRHTHDVVDYKGDVWCVQVPTGAFVARRNGHIFITGNSGFPKSMDISKAIDKKFGAEREVVGKTKAGSKERNGYVGDMAIMPFKTKTIELDITSPTTDEAIQWGGWGTALKPANEPIVVARKPLSEKTIAENVLKWGTGGLNIDGCRIPTEDNLDGGAYAKNGTPRDDGWGMQRGGAGEYVQPTGRFPANVILDEEAGKMLDEQSGISKSTGGRGEKSHGTLGNSVYGKYDNKELAAHAGGLGDSGGASRFFYCAKASKAERAGSKHPTVKPLSLMRYLCRLITPPEGIILDPFAGSGTTLEAAILEGFNVVGIEKEHDYIPDIRRRIERAQLNTQALEMDLFLTK